MTTSSDAETSSRSVTRRTALKVAAAGAAVPLASAALTSPTSAQQSARTFVLIHGAWHGGWCWGPVADILRSKGHKVYAPSLSGLADRSHLLSKAINLDTHIEDVVNLFKWEEIENAVLVGHSYGGWPISGAAEKLVGKIASIVFVDGFVPENGMRVIDTNAPQFRKPLEDAIAKGDVGRPFPKALAFGIIDPKKAAWVQEKLTPQPIGVHTQPIVLTGARERIAKKAYIRAVGFANPNFDKYYAAAKADNSWRTFDFAAGEAGHDIMVDAPQRLADILMQVA